MILHHIIQTIFVVAGVVATLASLLNWEWFFTARNAEFVVKRFGRTKSRIIYGTAGFVFIFVAVYFYYKIKQLQ